MKFLSVLTRFLPTLIAYAHCDVPCGIYDPKPAQIAAQTVLKMVQKIKGLDSSPLDKLGIKNDNLNDRNGFVRMVWTKEEHAQKCKEELLILWTDYFKEEHLLMFPNLHETFWKATKLCSKNKQEINIEAAKELVKAVDKIADIFQKTKTSTK
ncbi:MAG: superoxide dismutase, Ni [bacterium]|nr:superoxide dismutase, Ni [bacterium]